MKKNCLLLLLFGLVACNRPDHTGELPSTFPFVIENSSAIPFLQEGALKFMDCEGILGIGTGKNLQAIDQSQLKKPDANARDGFYYWKLSIFDQKNDSVQFNMEMFRIQNGGEPIRLINFGGSKQKWDLVAFQKTLCSIVNK